MVEDFEAPSMRISVVITSAELVEDTLHIPIRLQAERIPDGQHFIYTIPAYAYPQSRQTTSTGSDYCFQITSNLFRINCW